MDREEGFMPEYVPENTRFSVAPPANAGTYWQNLCVIVTQRHFAGGARIGPCLVSRNRRRFCMTITETRFSVSGMKCGGCVARATEALAKLPGFGGERRPAAGSSHARNRIVAGKRGRVRPPDPRRGDELASAVL